MSNLAIVFTPFSTSAECTVVETSEGVLRPRGESGGCGLLGRGRGGNRTR
jgi:hypothetical protein